LVPVRDGLNINDGVGACMVTTSWRGENPRGAHIGIALDGDADRGGDADAAGEFTNGDQLL